MQPEKLFIEGLKGRFVICTRAHESVLQGSIGQMTGNVKYWSEDHRAHGPDMQHPEISYQIDWGYRISDSYQDWFRYYDTNNSPYENF